MAQCPECGQALGANGAHPYNQAGGPMCGRAPLDLRRGGKEVAGDCPHHGPYYAKPGESVTGCPNCAKGRPPFRK